MPGQLPSGITDCIRTLRLSRDARDWNLRVTAIWDLTFTSILQSFFVFFFFSFSFSFGVGGWVGSPRNRLGRCCFKTDKSPVFTASVLFSISISHICQWWYNNAYDWTIGYDSDVLSVPLVPLWGSVYDHTCVTESWLCMHCVRVHLEEPL